MSEGNRTAQESNSDSSTRTHSHSSPGAQRLAQARAFDVIVVGGGHAGVEAGLAAARLGSSCALVSFRADLLGEMSCNPAIGGLGKGQLAREVDALGGAMGLATDATGIQFRMLNTAKGLAVQAPRAQSDRHAYRKEISGMVAAQPGLEVIEGGVDGLILEERNGKPVVAGIVLEDGRELRSLAVVITTGTFLRAIMHRGDAQESGGRAGERSSDGLTADFESLGLPTGRLKTGTPPRLAADSIRWDELEEQNGDAEPEPFSFLTDRALFPKLRQVPCHVTFTNERAHAIIRANIGRSPMYSGRIQGVGPRYCPAVEDKIMRFADRDRHQIFLEPEGLDCEEIYVNGLSTALPAEVQGEFLREVKGLEQARFLRHGYAVEYDFVQPSSLDPSMAVRDVRGLWLAGQINGTSGYEEAAAQGLLAGANAALWCQDRAPFTLGRHEAYIGVLADDLVVTNPTEPYRMFTSRAEYRLLLRQDDADLRLTPRAAEIGLCSPERARITEARRAAIQTMEHMLTQLRSAEYGGTSLDQVLRRPEVGLEDLLRSHPELKALAATGDVLTTVEANVKYAGYITRQRKDVERMRRQEVLEIPVDFDLTVLSGMRAEAREKLEHLRPRTLGAAGRIAGVNPPDIAL
ncbi:MAG: tRNA uridine 5-carboxymethylaminomethyl modification enzyme, partial [Planctomycetota bacterium]